MTTSGDLPWSLARGVGARVAGAYPLASSYHSAVLAEEIPRLVRSVGPLVAEETGLVGPDHPEIAVIDRAQWVDRNLGFMRHVLERHELAGEVSQATVAGGALQAGALLGFLGKRVLGQYELVLPTGDDGDTIFLVGDNVLQMERTHQFTPSEFRTWIVLHECTHRSQFVGVPWLRDYFLSLVDELIGSAGADPDRLLRLFDHVVDSVKAREPIIGDQGLFGLVATPAQRVLLDRVQALMSLLEGHGHVVMDRLGSRLLATQARMSQVLKARRNDPKMALFMRLTGLEMKMRQYEEGERFVLGVERLAGWDALNTAWESPAALPTLPEIAAPGEWLDRVA